MCEASIMRVLIVEDCVVLAEGMRDAFARRHIHADLAHSVLDAEIMLRTTGYVMAILDLGLPDEDGLHLLRRLRAEHRSEPVLIVSGRSALEARVEGLAAGADDYIVKPFHFDELHARVQAVLRRDTRSDGQRIVAGNLSLDPATREFRTGDRMLDLSVREGELLELLMRRFDHVVPKRMLEDQLFGSGDVLGSNAVEVYVHRVRKRLETEGVALAVQTVRGVGYMLGRA
jgi:DNA-binding response OmpR family regulator